MAYKLASVRTETPRANTDWQLNYTRVHPMVLSGEQSAGQSTLFAAKCRM